MLSYDKYSKNDGSSNFDNKYFDFQNNNDYLDIKTISHAKLGYGFISNFKDGSAPPLNKSNSQNYNEYLPENKDYQILPPKVEIDGVDHMNPSSPQIYLNNESQNVENLSHNINIKKTRISTFDDYFSISDLVIIFNVLISIYLLFKLHKLKNKYKKIKNQFIKLP